MRADLTPWLVRGIGFAAGVAIVVGMIALGAAAINVLVLVFVSVLVASALEPIVGWLRDRLPLGRAGTILVVYATFLAIALLLAFIVVPAAFNQASAVIASLPPFFAELRGGAAELRPNALSTSLTALIDSVAGIFAPAPPPDPDEVVEVGTAVAEAVVSLFTLFAIVFFWLVEHARLQRYVLAYLPATRRAGARRAWNEIETRLGLWVRGQLILMASVGVATGIAYTLLGVPAAVLLALIAALSEAIPIVGPLIGAIPAILVAATVSLELAVAVAVIYVILQLIEGALLVPLVMRNTVGISPFLVLVSLLIGTAAGGVLGAFLAVPVAASLEIILHRLQDRDSPVAQDPASIQAVDEEQVDDYERTLPDGIGAETEAP